MPRSPGERIRRQRYRQRKTCQRKVAIKSEGAARRVAIKMMSKKWEWFDHYLCPVCEKWHVGRTKKQFPIFNNGR